MPVTTTKVYSIEEAVLKAKRYFERIKKTNRLRKTITNPMMVAKLVAKKVAAGEYTIVDYNRNSKEAKEWGENWTLFRWLGKENLMFHDKRPFKLAEGKILTRETQIELSKFHENNFRLGFEAYQAFLRDECHVPLYVIPRTSEDCWLAVITFDGKFKPNAKETASDIALSVCRKLNKIYANSGLIKSELMFGMRDPLADLMQSDIAKIRHQKLPQLTYEEEEEADEEENLEEEDEDLG